MTSYISKRTPLLILADIASILLAIMTESFFRTGVWGAPYIKPYFFVGQLLIFPVLFYIFDLYYPYKIFKPGITFYEVFVSTLLGGVLLAALSYTDRDFALPRTVFLFTLLLMVPMVFLTRMIYDAIFKGHFLDKHTIFVGAGVLCHDLISVLQKTPHSTILPIGVILCGANKEMKGREAIKGVPILGTVEELETIIRKRQVDLAVAALELEDKNEENKVIKKLFKLQLPVTSAAHLLERLTGVVPRPLAENGHYVLSLMSSVKNRPYLKLKRLLDICAALVLLILFAPLLLLVMLALAFADPKNIFFIQDRVGFGGNKFKLIKLRSMMKSRNGRMVVTRFGKWLRKYRIDEVPQLLNVLKGDMSLIGPRPEIPYFVDRCLNKIPMYEAVFSVKPGLTGWAQVKFRYTTSVKDYREKFRYNLFYLKNMNFVLDMLILFKTVRIVLFGLGE